MLGNVFAAMRLTPDEVAALPEEKRAQWLVFKAACDKTREISAEMHALPRRSSATRAVWAAHDAKARAHNKAHIAAFRAFAGIVPAR